MEKLNENFFLGLGEINILFSGIKGAQTPLGGGGGGDEGGGGA